MITKGNGKRKMIMENVGTLGEGENASMSTDTESLGVESAIWLYCVSFLVWVNFQVRFQFEFAFAFAFGRCSLESFILQVAAIAIALFSVWWVMLGNELERVKTESPTLLNISRGLTSGPHQQLEPETLVQLTTLG